MNLKLSGKRLLLAIALCGAIAAPITSSLLRGAPARLAMEHAQSVLGLFEARSPGERTAAELTKTKRERSVGEAYIDEDLERALGKEFPPHEVSTFASPEHLLALAATPDLVEFSAEDTPLQGGGSGLGYLIPPNLIGTGDDGGGGGGPGVGGPGGDGTVDAGPSPSIIPPAVPEPATWAMMVLGMGLCGYALRRRNRIRISGATWSCEVS